LLYRSVREPTAISTKGHGLNRPLNGVSSALIYSLLPHGVIDEYRLAIYPILREEACGCSLMMARFTG
jgi:hypothetical protein